MWVIRLTSTEIVWWVAGARITYSGKPQSRWRLFFGTIVGAKGYLSFACRRWLQTLLGEGRFMPATEITREFTDLLRFYIAKGSPEYRAKLAEAAELREAHARMFEAGEKQP